MITRHLCGGLAGCGYAGRVTIEAQFQAFDVEAAAGAEVLRRLWPEIKGKPAWLPLLFRQDDPDGRATFPVLPGGSSCGMLSLTAGCSRRENSPEEENY